MLNFSNKLVKTQLFFIVFFASMFSSNSFLAHAQTVSYLKMESPVASPLFSQFVLSGTFPVPKDLNGSCVSPRPDGQEPFKVEVNGTLYPAQTTVVTRYPQSLCASVVQLEALVPNVNQTTLFMVVLSPHARFNN